MRDLSSLTKDWTRGPCNARWVFKPLDHRGRRPVLYFKLCFLFPVVSDAITIKFQVTIHMGVDLLSASRLLFCSLDFFIFWSLCLFCFLHLTSLHRSLWVCLRCLDHGEHSCKNWNFEALGFPVNTTEIGPGNREHTGCGTGPLTTSHDQTSWLESAYMFSVKKQKGTLACLSFIFPTLKVYLNY